MPVHRAEGNNDAVMSLDIVLPHLQDGVDPNSLISLVEPSTPITE
jgi:hypothetical protein